MQEKIRIDKYLFAVRIFKSRSQAADACDKNKIRINGTEVKAARNIIAGEIIEVRKGAFTGTFKVLQLAEKRMAAKFVAAYCQDITPPEEIEKIKMHSLALRMSRNPGTGRPTKNERRALDDFFSWGDE